MSADAVLVIAFGGPESMDEVRPFLARVLAGRPVPPERLESVVHHYELIGGRSPGPEITRRQTTALAAELSRAGKPLHCELGMRTSAPFLTDALTALAKRGARTVVGLIMAAHESPASHGRYREALEKARAELDAPAIDVRYAPSFHMHPGFVEAHVAHLRTVYFALSDAERAQARLIFTAHSIPLAAAEGSPYVRELEQSASAVAAALDVSDYAIAYQSRSGNPRDPWLEPDINDALRAEAARGTRVVVLCPIGFVCDHVEVLYDLDIEAAATARELGIALYRAAAPNDHPAFVRALADSVRAAAG